jgi:hypothetical protein
MKKSLIRSLIPWIGLGQLVGISTSMGIPESFGKRHIQREATMPHPKPMQAETASTLQEEPANASSKREDIDHRNTTRHNLHIPIGEKAAAAIEQRVGTANNSGLTGTTSFIVMSGVPGGVYWRA